jgi:hypothetical protein
MTARKHIPLREKLACALAAQLPQDERVLLIQQRADAELILRRFEWHHVALRSRGGADAWYNLDPMPVAAHRARTPADISLAAKSRRLEERWAPFMRAMAAGQKPPRRVSRWRKSRTITTKDRQ